MDLESNFLICDYFNAKGKRVERIFMPRNNEDAIVAAQLETVTKGEVDAAIRKIKSAASARGEATKPEEAALALSALVAQVVNEEINIYDAREIVSIGVDFKSSVAIPDVMPALERNHGSNVASWVRGIFPALKLGHPGLQ